MGQRGVRPDFLAALEFAQGADDITDPAELNRQFGEVVRPFGVRYFSTIVAAVPGQPMMPRILSGRVDPAWSLRYASQGFAAVDPVLAALFETRKPFTWREAAARRPSPTAQRVLGEARDVTGVDEALVVPIHDRMGEIAAVILSGEGVIFDAEVRPVLHLASVYFSGVARDLEEPTPPAAHCVLTARQLECLRWVMDGKSDWEIGEILGISEHTAHNHIEAAKRTLGVGTRIQASVHAWRHGWLI
jgi:LuxR family quorum sensing-dependent transcriptional regulator